MLASAKALQRRMAGSCRDWQAGGAVLDESDFSVNYGGPLHGHPPPGNRVATLVGLGTDRQALLADMLAAAPDRHGGFQACRKALPNLSH